MAQGDFEGAALIRERRMGIQSGKAAGGAGRAAVVLSPGTARTTAAVDFADAKKEVTVEPFQGPKRPPERSLS